MSVQLYEELRETASELLDEFGVAGTINHQAGGKSSTSIVFIEKKKNPLEPASAVPLIAEQVNCIVKGSVRKPPQVGDFVVTEKQSFTITEVFKIRPGSVTVIYRLVGTL